MPAAVHKSKIRIYVIFNKFRFLIKILAKNKTELNTIQFLSHLFRNFNYNELLAFNNGNCSINFIQSLNLKLPEIQFLFQVNIVHNRSIEIR